MKKIFLLFTVLMTSGASLVAYTHTIFNTTPGKVRVNLDELACRDDDVTIDPGESKEVGVGLCLVDGIEARGLTGPVAGKHAKASTKGNKARGREWFINYVDYKTVAPGTGSGVNINLASGQKVTIVPGSGKMEIEQE